MSAICSHTASIELTELPEAIAGVPRVPGDRRHVHLRMCQTCGRIRCCDSSPHRHASAHARTSQYPIARSAGPGEDWSWCYLD